MLPRARWARARLRSDARTLTEGRALALKIHSTHHHTHFIRDLADAAKRYGHVFETELTPDPPDYHPGENRDAQFLWVSDAYIDLFCPRDGKTENPQTASGRFMNRWGEGM